jgi:hypothetical protein
MLVQTNVHTPRDLNLPTASTASSEISHMRTSSIWSMVFSFTAFDPLPSFPPESAGNQDRRAGLFGRPDLANASYGAIAEHSL